MPFSSVPSTVLDALSEPVLFVDAAWQVRAANVAARALLDAPGTGDPDAAGTRGEARPGIEERSILSVLTPRQAAVVERCLNEATTSGTSARHPVRDPDAGTTHVTEVLVTPQDGAFWVILYTASSRVLGEAAGGVASVARDGSDAAASITQGLIEAGIS